jgi:hypothetical protein
MISTTSNHYAEAATAESKTGYYKESPGETQDTNRGGVSKTVGGRVLRAMNDALPYKLRPIKAKRRRARRTYGCRHELFAFRMVWHSHHGPALAKKIESIKKLVWK